MSKSNLILTNLTLYKIWRSNLVGASSKSEDNCCRVRENILYVVTRATSEDQIYFPWSPFRLYQKTALKIVALRKHAYSNIKKSSPPKTENFQIKYSEIFHISAENIYCGFLVEPPWRDGSNKYLQSMFSSKNKKNNVFPCKPQFKVGFKGVKII